MSGIMLKAPEASEWTIREQLILASAVQRSGDQNWVSVSRAIKPLVDTDSRPADYFSQKNCAQQYSAMLDKAGTHKRKRSIEGTSEAAETAGQQIVRELTEKYINYLNQALSKTKDEYVALKKEIERIESGELDPKLPAMWEEIQKETAKTKSPLPASSLGKHLHQDQVKQKKKRSPSSQHTQKEVVAESVAPTSDSSAVDGPALAAEKETVPAKIPAKGAITPAKATVTPAQRLVGPDKGIMTPDKRVVTPDKGTITPAVGIVTPLEDPTAKKIKVEPSPVESAPRVSVSEATPTIGTGAFITSGLELHPKPPMTVTIKKEPPTTPSPMEVDTRLIPTLPSPSAASLSPREGLPMHTPQPSTHGGQVTGEVHVIVQQPNIAALLVPEESTKKISVSSSAPRLSPDVSAGGQRPVPSPVTVSCSVGSLTSMLQPVRTTSTAVGLHKQLPVLVPPRAGVKSFPVPVTHTSPIPTLLQGKSHIVVGVEPKRLEQVAVKIEGQTGWSKPPTVSTSSHTTTPSPVTAQVGVSLPPPLPTLSTRPTPTLTTPSPAALPAPPTIQLHPRPAALPIIQPHSKPAAMRPTVQAHPRPTAPTAPPTILAPKPSALPVPVKLAERAKPSPSVESLLLQRPSSNPLLKQTLKPALKLQASELFKSAFKQEQQGPEKLLKSQQQQATEEALKSATKQVSAGEPPKAASTGEPQRSDVRAVAAGSVGQVESTVKGREGSVTVPVTVSKQPARTHVTVAGTGVGVTKTTPTTSQDMPTDPRVRPAPVVLAPPPPPPVTAAVVTPPPATPTPPIPTSMQAPPPVVPMSRTTPTSSAPPLNTLPLNVKETAAVTPQQEPVKQESVPHTNKKDHVMPAAAPPPPPPPSPPVKEKQLKTLVSSAPPTPATPLSPMTSTPTSVNRDSKLPTPSSELDSKTVSPVEKGAESRAVKEEDVEAMDEETPVKPPPKVSRSSLKKHWNTRSRKRGRGPFDEGHSVESTDTEDDIFSSHTSAVSSPAPSQSNDTDQENVVAHKQWKKAIIIVWRHAAQHKYANLFLHPVREEDAPGYKNVILRRMDLSTIKKKIESGLIKTDIEFQRDMLLMFQNAFMYNNTEHEVYFMAQEMKNDVMENIQAYLATQAQLQLMEDTTPSKTLRSREGRLKEQHEESVFSPAKKRRTRADD